MHISGLLEKFKKFGLQSILTRETIAEFLTGYYKTPFTKESVFVTNGVITVKTSPVIKNDIYIKREYLISTLKEKLPKVYLVDIR
ncbi:MAG: hypothetical protein EXS50_03050 [Candidatus Taylorbacteria bacterium]|nr:hypothetical protein [Candidatus Taylorbacteria bacterium]